MDVVQRMGVDDRRPDLRDDLLDDVDRRVALRDVGVVQVVQEQPGADEVGGLLGLAGTLGLVAAALGVLLFFVAAVSWLAAAFGLLVRAPEAANSAMFFLMFFCYASSAFVPVRTMPTWLRGFAEHQPATPVTETIRGLLRGGPAPVGSALAWCAGIMVVSVALSAVLFRRRTAA
ncbi:MAG TPA: ABC transporter permease [Streptosporangiaceae bacterium]|nr:ABC transporter permease [Streptosporangiaceae bacterium]